MFFVAELKYNISITESIMDSEYILQFIDLGENVGIFSVNSYLELSKYATELQPDLSGENPAMKNSFCILLFLDVEKTTFLYSNVIK